MRKVQITRDWSGYSRGYTVVELEVTDEDLQRIKSGECDPRDLYDCGVEVGHEIVRDDTESSGYEIDLGEK